MSIQIGPPSTPTTVVGEAADFAINEAAGDQLKGIRGAADGWQKGLAGLLTILTSVFFLKGVDSFTKLEQVWQYAAAILLLVGAGAAAISGYFMLRAAYGNPMPADLEDVRKQGLYAWRFNLAAGAAANLKNGQVFFAVVLACFALAVGATWFGARGTTPGFQVRLGKDCGQLEATDNGQFKLVADKQLAVLVTKSQLVDARIVEKCE